MRRTTVENIASVTFNRSNVYIGRGRGSKFGNPYTLKDHTREEAIAKFKTYFIERVKRDDEFAQAVRELRGKVLVCFCAPQACHGNVIADYVDGIEWKLWALTDEGRRWLCENCARQLKVERVMRLEAPPQDDTRCSECQDDVNKGFTSDVGRVF